MKNPKMHLARKMMSKDDIKNHVPPFGTIAWSDRVIDKQDKVKNRLAKILTRREKRLCN